MSRIFFVLCDEIDVILHFIFTFAKKYIKMKTEVLFKNAFLKKGSYKMFSQKPLQKAGLVQEKNGYTKISVIKT